MIIERKKYHPHKEVYSFYKYLCSVYYVPSSGDTVMKQRSLFLRGYVLVGGLHKIYVKVIRAKENKIGKECREFWAKRFSSSKITMECTSLRKWHLVKISKGQRHKPYR